MKQRMFALTTACTLLFLVGASASSDYYQCYQFGSCAEPTLSNDSNCRSGTDYDVTVSNRNSPVTVLSFHGGNIELNTSGISNALSNLYGWNRYDFNAHATSACTTVGTYQGNKLHITSTNFNDPRAVSLVSAQPKAVSIHGYSDKRGYDKGVICVGGKDNAARNVFISYVQNNAAAWNANPNTYTLNPRDAVAAADGTECGDDEIRGLASANLVNRTSSNAGLQLELSPQFRADLVNTSSGFDDLRNLIYGAIRQAMIGPTCYTATAGGSWINNSFASQAGAFTAEWDATPSANNIDAVMALSNGAQTSFTGFACLARFNSTGEIDARDGGAYHAASTIPYIANTSYHFRLSVNVPTHTYSIYVTPAGGTEQIIGLNYAFRTEQTTVGSLNNYGLVIDSAAGSATMCNFTVSGSNTLFQDSFTGSDSLITNEYAHWNSDGIVSPDWDMTSGSLFRQSNTAWTGLPDSFVPNKYSSDHTDSDVFRVNTFRTFAGNIKVSLALKNNSEIHDPNCSACWHGVNVWLRYLTQYDLYAVSLNRVDNTVTIKRKVPCGSENSGFYKDLTSAVTHPWTVGTWQHYSLTIQTNSNGSVTIKLYDDDSDPNTPLIQATDSGGTNLSWTSGCTTPGHYPTAQYPPITAAGSVGIRGDYDNFNFDDFRVSSF